MHYILKQQQFGNGHWPLTSKIVWNSRHYNPKWRSELENSLEPILQYISVIYKITPKTFSHGL